MSREAFLELLSRYRAPDPEQREARQKIEEFIRAHPDCFKRELLTGHVTGSAWVLNPARDKALLVHHKKLGLWLQPGGHCDGDPEVAAVALREAREESGIPDVALLLPEIFDLDIHEIPEQQGLPAHLHYDVRFLAYCPGSGACAASSESHAVEWFSPRDIDYVKTDASVRRLRDKWIKNMQAR